MHAIAWKDRLEAEGRMPADLADEIDLFEAQIGLRRQGGIDERIFAETRLRRGVYGQRYDNGQRHDGVASRRLAFPSELTKGPETYWDAPGMLRIKIPYGGVTPEQLDVLADLAEEYSDSILHITTRQDVQLHYVHIEDTPTIMRRLAAVDITTREACGNSVRNVTACPLAGVCHTESFDVTPYAKALMRFLLGHPDCQDFGRKFKIAFSGCATEACGLVRMHDFGAIAVTRTAPDGSLQRGFEVYVGGGLGTTPQQAKLLEPFTPAQELLPVCQAIARVFARLGEKQNRNRARIKFLVSKLGMEEFARLVREERAVLPHDPRWTSYLAEVPSHAETPLRAPLSLNGHSRPEAFEPWLRNNVYRQRQDGYAVATVALPLGDLSSWQTRRLADIARRYVGDTVRTTVEQNVVLRWVAEADLPALHEELSAIGLGDATANTIVDVTACPGTDTCKLGISSSRGLAGELRERLGATALEMDEAVRGLRIKVSGCFNSCGQHHVADIGFFGNSRKIGGHTVPHFQVVLGGKWQDNAGAYGLAIGSVPSKRIPEVVDLITSRFVAERLGGESFQDFIARLGKKELGAMLTDVKQVPPYELDRTLYSDWSDPREFSMGDYGQGECAGEVVSRTDMELSMAESLAFDAQLALEDGDLARADERAYEAMLLGATALVRTQLYDVPGDRDALVREFRERFYDTKLFFDRFSGGKFARPLFERHASGPVEHTADSARELLEETQLFIDAAHACQIRISGAQSALI